MVSWAVAQASPTRSRKGRRKRRAGPRTPRKTGSNTTRHVLVTCGLLALILGSYVLVAPWRASKSATGTQIGSQSAATPPEISTQPPTLPGKPAGTGRIVITEKQKVACRELGFDNYSGRFSDYGAVACDGERPSAAAQPNYATPVNRLEAIRRTFSSPR